MNAVDTHLHLWADWIGSLAGPLRFGVFALVLAVVMLFLLFAYAIVGQFLGYLLEERIRVRLPMTPEPDADVMQQRLIATMRGPAAKGFDHRQTVVSLAERRKAAR